MRAPRAGIARHAAAVCGDDHGVQQHPCQDTPERPQVAICPQRPQQGEVGAHQEKRAQSRGQRRAGVAEDRERDSHRGREHEPAGSAEIDVGQASRPPTREHRDEEGQQQGIE